MKHLLLIIAFLFIFTIIIQAQKVSQIEGYLEVYHPVDSSSLYIGKGAGLTADPAFLRSNTIVGNNAGESLTTGGGNSFFGRNAGKLNSTGMQNSFFGENSGMNNSDASGNSFFGMASGLSNTTGFKNSFFGQDAGRNNTTAGRNSFFGENAGFSNSTGANNSFFGNDAGFNNTASDNSFFGQAAGLNNTTATSNSFFGKDAGKENTIGGWNSFFGYQSGLNNSEGEYNSFFGESAGRANTTGDWNSFFGQNAGSGTTSGNLNSFFGKDAGHANSTGFGNCYFGQGTGLLNSTGSFNSFFGLNAGLNLLGGYNVCIGADAGPSVQTNASNRLYIDVMQTDTPLIYGRFDLDLTRINGFLEVVHPEDSTSLYIGGDAGQNISPGFQWNTIVGNQAAVNLTTGGQNNFFGCFSGLKTSGGDRNAFFGQAAGVENTTGTENCFFGWGSGPNISTGSNNSFFGAQAGINLTGSGNVCVGSYAGPSFGNGDVNNRLFINNATTNTPLIYGEFDNDLLQINGTLTMGNTNYFSGGDDGVIRSSTEVSSDLFLVSNDAVIIELDDDTGEGGNFEIWNDADRKVMVMLEDGTFEIWDGQVSNNRTLWFQPDGDLVIDGMLTEGSDRNRKENIKAVDPHQVLAKLMTVPVSTWSYKGDNVPHMGPMAQDFYAAFQLGETETGIGSVDMQGALLAAVQALAAENDVLKSKLAEQASVLHVHQKAIDELRQEMEQFFSQKGNDQ